MENYIAVLHEGKNGYGVIFPDFPGCTSFGNDFEDALREAAEALSIHVEGMQEDGLVIPSPRDLREIRAAGEDWIDLNNAVFATVPLLPPPGKKVRTGMTIDNRLLSMVSRITNNSSAFLKKRLANGLRVMPARKDISGKHL